MSSAVSINDKNYLTKTNRISFAVAGFGQNLIIGVVNSYILFFYTDIFLLGAAPAGILMIVARIWDALNDPIMGTIVDKTRTRFGKMRPYILASAIPLAINTALLFVVPTGLSAAGKIAYAYITYILWGMIYTMCDVPFWGLASAMTPNPKERIKFISQSRLVHSIGGTLPMLIIPLMTGLVGNEKGYTLAGITIGIVGGALFLFAFFGTKERTFSKGKAPTLKQCFKYLKINKPLRVVVIANLMAFLRELPVAAGMYVSTYIIKKLTISIGSFSIDLNGAILNTLLLIGWGASGFLGMILTPAICKKLNYKQIFFIFSIIGSASATALYFIGANFWAIFVCLFVCGMPFGIISNCNYAMIADSVEYVEWKTGKRTEGVTVSFQTLMNKLKTALQVGTVSLALIFIGFVQPIEVDGKLITQPQSDMTLNGFFLLITILPAIGWLLGIIPMMFYSFIGKERQAAHLALSERRMRIDAIKESRLRGDNKYESYFFSESVPERLKEDLFLEED